ncbi:MAG TPA: hypothetical protein VFL80_05920 [Thermoanaerobaculia bacterium]|nr:hypothetical protein [Thermoanaerobaculia bacterium]
MDPVSDTTPAAERIRAHLLARMSPEEKLERVRELTLAVQRLSFTGLRAMHPQATDDEIWLRMATYRLGKEVVRRVYGRATDLR